jgi:hypothetical protein
VVVVNGPAAFMLPLGCLVTSVELLRPVVTSSIVCLLVVL